MFIKWIGIISSHIIKRQKSSINDYEKRLLNDQISLYTKNAHWKLITYSSSEAKYSFNKEFLIASGYLLVPAKTPLHSLDFWWAGREKSTKKN